ncbi:MAG: MGMT family protein [Patescibacteria group bacterium]
MLIAQGQNLASQVYRLTRRVPRGRVTTYQAIACALGRPRAFRAVGNALNKNPYAPQVPCHRVVRSNGKVGGFAGGTRKKIMMLKQEGVKIKNNKIDLSEYLYDFKRKR